MEEMDHLSYSSKQCTSNQSLDRGISEYSNISLPEDNVYEHISHIPGGRVKDGKVSNRLKKEKKNKPKHKFRIAFISLIIVLIATGLTLSVIVGVMIHLEYKVSHQQLLLNADKTYVNETIQVYLNREIEKLGKSFKENLESEVSKLNTSINIVQDIFKNSLEDKKALYRPSLLPSSAAIYQNNPSSPSGYYFIYSSTQQSHLKVYCDMARTCGDSTTRGWMRVTQMNISNPSSQCPPGLCLSSTGLLRTCKICGSVKSCSSDNFFIGVSYTKVCGRILGYQVGLTSGLEQILIGPTLHTDGVELTYGKPKKHIWTFAAARSEVYYRSAFVCPCINKEDSFIPSPPSFVGSYYFCDTGAVFTPSFGQLFSNNTLWDGMGCSHGNECCSYNNPPWFFRQLPNSTNDDIEMSVCRTGRQLRKDVAIEVIDIYVQ